MKSKILTFSPHGDTALLEYDPATADMEEVNKVTAEYEAKTGAQPFDMTKGERIEKVTREHHEALCAELDRRLRQQTSLSRRGWGPVASRPRSDDGEW